MKIQKKKKIIQIPQLINPTFYKIWTAPQKTIALGGGRTSTKSSVISLKLAVLHQQNKDGNIICLRKIGKYLRDSVYNQITWALHTLGVANQYNFRISPMTILHKKTGTGFYFYGVDDPLKIKSAIMPRGRMLAIWFEEFLDFKNKEDVDIVQDTFIRANDIDEYGNQLEVLTLFSYNPSRNPYNWINEWIEEQKGNPDFLYHHSTYKDDVRGFVSPQIKKKIEQYKINDYDYYRWMYGGEVVGLGDTVYNIDLFKPLDSLPTNDQVFKIFYAMDTGHSASATTVSCYGYTRNKNIILLDTYYYSPANKIIKKAPSELAKDVQQFEEYTSKKYPFNIAKRTIDSAEGALRNQIYKDYGKHWHPVAKSKKTKMIDYTYDLLGQGRFYYLDIPENKVFIDQHKKYAWKTETLKTDDPRVIEVDDHCPDQFQYLIKDNLREFDLKF